MISTCDEECQDHKKVKEKKDESRRQGDRNVGVVRSGVFSTESKYVVSIISSRAPAGQKGKKEKSEK